MITTPQRRAEPGKGTRIDFGSGANDANGKGQLNQMKLADVKPRMKGRSPPLVALPLNAPNIMVPSMRACGLSHVTTNAATTIFQEWLVDVFAAIQARFRPNKAYAYDITSRPPSPSMIFLSHGNASMSAPAPKKHVTPREMSQNITTRRR